MTEKILNAPLLEKNIEQISLYIQEEKRILNKIYNVLDDCNKFYCSKNTNLLSKETQNLKKNIPDIIEKRRQYVSILDEAITLYSSLVLKTQQIFESGIGHE